MDGLTRLSAAIDELARESDHGVPAAALPSRLLALHRAAARLHAQLLRTTAAFEASGQWRADGAVSAGAWIRQAARVSDGAAREHVRSGRLLRDLLPETAAALAVGDIGVEHARVMVRAATATPGRRATVTAAEPTLVAAARRLGPRALAGVVRRWAEAVDPGAGLADAECAFAARRLSVSPTLDGMVAVDGLLDPESGATLIAAVQALAAPGAHRAGDGADVAGDDRTPAQRRADALVQLARTALDAGALPLVGGERPHLLVSLDVGALTGGAGAASLTGHVRDLPLTGAAAGRLACDAVVTPLRWTSDGPVDVGRSTRTVPLRLRRLLAVRDRGCRFPGCDRPLAWCDAHHVIPWVAGGGTDAGNLLMLCRRHHRAVHEGGFALTCDPHGRITVRRPDGSLLVQDLPPPPSADTG